MFLNNKGLEELKEELNRISSKSPEDDQDEDDFPEGVSGSADEAYREGYGYGWSHGEDWHKAVLARELLEFLESIEISE